LINGHLVSMARALSIVSLKSIRLKKEMIIPIGK